MQTESWQNQIKELIEQNFDRKKVGRSANPRAVRLHECSYDGEEVVAALECLLSTYVTMGAKTRRAEAAWSRYTGTRESLMVNSGSSANLLALAALCNPMTPNGLKPGDEVIVPALCWSTTIWPVMQCGLVPVIVDIDPVTLNISIPAIKRALSEKTRAIMLVHVYGNPCDMTALLDICEAKRLILIEDACEALGAKYDGKHVGGFGRIGTFSTYYSHHITSLEGGFIVTNDEELAEIARMLRAHGWVRELKKPEKYLSQYPDIDPRFLFVNTGYNLRPTELQAAFIEPQLTKLDAYIDRRRENAAWWSKRFASTLAKVADIQQEQPRGYSSFFGYPIVFRDSARLTARGLRQALKQKDIESRPLIGGNFAEQPAVKLFPHRIPDECVVAHRIMRSGMTWGNHHEVDDAARVFVAETVEEYLQQG